MTSELEELFLRGSQEVAQVGDDHVGSSFLWQESRSLSADAVAGMLALSSQDGPRCHARRNADDLVYVRRA